MADRKTVPGSERRLVPGHRRVGDVDGAAEIDVSVYLRGPLAGGYACTGLGSPNGSALLQSLST